jgi:hypothetical protein
MVDRERRRSEGKWIAAASAVRQVSARGAGRRSAQGVVAAEDGASALRDFEVRRRGGQGVENDRPLGVPRPPATNLLCRGRRARGRHRGSQILDRAAAVVVAVELEERIREVLGWREILLSDDEDAKRELIESLDEKDLPVALSAIDPLSDGPTQPCSQVPTGVTAPSASPVCGRCRP